MERGAVRSIMVRCDWEELHLAIHKSDGWSPVATPTGRIRRT